MGHRANFVVIRDAEAKAYYDQWAALGVVYQFADGPEAALAGVNGFEETTELTDWAFAEGGYLVDFDERRAIVFGTPAGEDFDLDELGDFADLPGVSELAAAAGNAAARIDRAFEESPLAFLRLIADKWPGWQLAWDDRGVDAFAEHLERRAIGGLTTQPKSHPADAKRYELPG